MTKNWQWWSGCDGETFTQGPFDKREDAIDEAFDQGDFAEEQLNDGTWIGRVYVLEAKGTYYECTECGVVEKACAECAASLNYDEPVWYFECQRNASSVVRILEEPYP